jgi:hypothetical protein
MRYNKVNRWLFLLAKVQHQELHVFLKATLLRQINKKLL